MPVYLGDSLPIRLLAFFMKFSGFWTSGTQRGKRIMKFATMTALVSSSAIVPFVLIDIYYCHSNFEEIANGFLTFSMVGIALHKLVIITPQRKKFLDLVSYAQKNFWYCTYDSYGVSVMNKCLTKCTYMFIFISFMCIVSLVTYLVKPLIVDRGKNETERTLPVQLHFSFIPISVTPWYEILYVLEVPSTFYIAICFICFDNFLCGINMTLVGQFTILNKQLRSVYTESSMDENIVCLRFNKCVRIHQELIACADTVKELYKNVIIGLVFFLSILICMEMFQVMTCVGQTFIRIRALIYTFTTTGQLYILTLTCNSLTERSLEMSNAAYDVRWFSIKSNRIKKELMYGLKTVIMRSQRPCQLTVGNFSPVTLKTFTSICNTAFSILTLMRRNAQLSGENQSTY